MPEKKLFAKNLLDFIDQSPTAFHATQNIVSSLKTEGFSELKESDPWELSASGKYFVVRNQSGVIAFTIGTNSPVTHGIKMIGAHTDSPLLKIKNDSFKFVKRHYVCTTEVYGGPILSTWLDRDLSVAGRVSYDNGKEIANGNVNFNSPIALIPNLAIHLNRQINKGFEYNPQTHLQAFFTGFTDDPQEYFEHEIAKQLGIKKEQIIESDLYLYDYSKGSISGIRGDLISTGRLDNLAMCHAALNAIVTASSAETSKMAFFYDAEEIGSATIAGAASNFAKAVIERIAGSLKGYHRLISKSFQISADMAHAYHPSYSEKYDPDYAPAINAGPVIKYNAKGRYATTSESSAYLIKLARNASIPIQKMANRSDIPSGSTIGPISSTLLGVKTVDVGNPLWGMHSIRETIGVLDHYAMTMLFKSFYEV